MGILDFQNRGMNIKLLIFHVNWDNQAYLEKWDFQQKFICQIWDSHWICSVEASPEGVSNPNSEFQLDLHAKRDKVKLAFLIVNLGKCDVLQTTPNLDILYTIGKNVLPWVWIQYRCLKTRLHLARINWQSLLFLYEKMCRQFGHFHHEWRVPLG